MKLFLLALGGVIAQRVKLVPDLTGYVSSFGDWDDLRTLMYVINSLQNTVEIWSMNTDSKLMAKLEASIDVNDSPIQNVQTVDFNQDGRLDVLVQIKGSNEELIQKLYLNNGKGYSLVNLPPSSLAQPFALDFFGNFSMSLFGQLKGASNFSLWTIYENDSFITHLNGFEGCVLAHPHSSAWVDLNGDCKADLLLFCEDGGFLKTNQYIRIYSNTQEGFLLEKDILIPADVNNLALGDMDSDGMIDLIYGSCSANYCYLAILHNNESIYCENGKCRRDLCGNPSNVSFETPVIYKLPDIIGSNLKFKNTNERFQGYKARFSIKIVDYNHDGFPDIIALFENNRYYMFRSTPCSSTLCKNPKMRRTFVEDTDWSKAFAKIPGTDMHGVWADFNGDGTLDFLITTWINYSHQESYIIFNDVVYDCLFIKSQVQSSSKSIYPGASFKYAVSDPFGAIRAIQVAQLPQMSYMEAMTPYVIFGLGRTSNYIQDLFIGIPLNITDYFKVYHGIIPNSRMLITPSMDSGLWKIQLIVAYTSAIFGTTIVLVTMLILFCGIIYSLHKEEEREDELERRRSLHRINFDAL